MNNLRDVIYGSCLGVDVADDEVVEEGAAQEGLGDHSHMTSALGEEGV